MHEAVQKLRSAVNNARKSEDRVDTAICEDVLLSERQRLERAQGCLV